MHACKHSSKTKSKNNVFGRTVDLNGDVMNYYRREVLRSEHFDVAIDDPSLLQGYDDAIMIYASLSVSRHDPSTLYRPAELCTFNLPSDFRLSAFRLPRDV